MQYLINILWVVYIFVCFILMFIVLIQRGETGGLSSAFGGGGGETAFGVKADTAWKKATAIFAALFLGLSLLIGQLAARQSYGTVAAATEAPPAAPVQPIIPGGVQPIPIVPPGGAGADDHEGHDHPPLAPESPAPAPAPAPPPPG